MAHGPLLFQHAGSEFLGHTQHFGQTLEISGFFQNQDVLGHVDNILAPEGGTAVGFQNGRRVRIFANFLVDESRLAATTIDIARNFAG